MAIQQPLFDVDAGIEARDAALDRVEQAAPDDWLFSAHRAVVELARSRPTLTTDDVWNMLGGASPPEPRAMGAVMSSARACGQIVATDEYTRSKRPKCHCRPIRVWKSLLYRPQS